MIDVQGLSYQYPGCANPALENIKFHVASGSLFGLLGPNGAGKTTLLSILTGLISISEAKVRINDQDLHTSMAEIKAISSIVPQEYAFYPALTVLENLNFFAGVQNIIGDRRKSRIEYCVEFCRLTEVEQQKAGTLSGGLKRRLNLAIGLLSDPQILYLDEPTVGIDPQSRAFILKQIAALNDQGKTIIYTSHYMEEVEQLCDNLVIIDHGKLLLGGSLKELLTFGINRLEIDFAQMALAGWFDFLPEPLELELDGRRAVISNCTEINQVNTVLQKISEQTTSVSSISYGKTSLEQLFLTLTQRELRD